VGLESVIFRPANLKNDVRDFEELEPSPLTFVGSQPFDSALSLLPKSDRFLDLLNFFHYITYTECF
jgi:hypothetical protein